jgi:hypothetical protein
MVLSNSHDSLLSVSVLILYKLSEANLNLTLLFLYYDLSIYYVYVLFNSLFSDIKLSLFSFILVKLINLALFL